METKKKEQNTKAEAETFAATVKGMNRDDQLMLNGFLMDTLRDFGLGDLIKETVNAQSLQGAMSNLAAENDDQLPDEFQDCVNTYEFYDVTRSQMGGAAQPRPQRSDEKPGAEADDAERGLWRHRR